MTATASVQDYLAGIYDLAGSGRPVIAARLAKHLAISAPAVTESVQRLTRGGYVRIGMGKALLLTTKGREVAEVMARRHRLLERQFHQRARHRLLRSHRLVQQGLLLRGWELVQLRLEEDGLGRPSRWLLRSLRRSWISRLIWLTRRLWLLIQHLLRMRRPLRWRG